MNELTVVDKATEWRRMKGLVLDSVRSPITKRVYNMGLNEFFDWYRLEQRPGFTKATVNAWRVSLDERGLGSSSIIVRMSAIRKLRRFFVSKHRSAVRDFGPFQGLGVGWA
jgi:hypothetical protein